jgi:tetratricopeptide (TPR) repeat protein
MTKYFQWIVLTSITGSPLLSILLLGIFWWATDRFTLRILPDPFRPFLRWQRTRKLEHELSMNPHNRQARLELADLYVGQRRSSRAVEVLRPNVEAGDDDPATLFTLGLALCGSGHPERAEPLWDVALERDPRFRLGAIHLERGRWRLARGDGQGARTALEALLLERTGTIEGRVLLARALDRLGDSAAAARMREEAWREYVSSPGHVRRMERWWAWRAKPQRPLAIGLVLALCLFLGARYVGPSMQAWAQSSHLRGAAGMNDD